MNSDKFKSIENHPDEFSAANIIVRLLDGLGFRYYWTVKGMDPGNMNFRPAEGRWSIAETMDHIWLLLNWVSMSGDGIKREKPENFETLSDSVLEIISSLRDMFENASIEDLEKYRINGLPLWFIINGPLSDTMMHIGQIDTLRRIANDPPEDTQYFPGLPPK